MRKKLIVLLLFTFLSTCLAACGSSDEKSASTVSKNTQSASNTQSTSTQKPASSVLDTKSIPAPSLANNVVSEPATQGITVYLPPSYQTGEKSYPVVYFLPGFGDDYAAYGNSFKDAMDRLIASGKVKDMIVVTMNGNNVIGGSFYYNSPTTGNWEDFVVKDVVGYVDSNYRTIKDAKSRGISGHSMGGFGAINAAMHHPELFSSLYSMSPGIFAPGGIEESPFAVTEDALNQLETLTSYIQGDFANAYGAAFLPDSKAPFMKYPLKKVNGKVVKDEALMKQWESGYGAIDEKVKKYGDNLKKFKSIVIEYGKQDEFAWIPKGCDYFSQVLKTAGINNKLVSFEGKHQDQTIQRFEEFALPFFSEQLAF